MKNLFFLTLLIGTFFSCFLTKNHVKDKDNSVLSENIHLTDSVFNFLSQINYKNYYGKEIGMLLSNDSLIKFKGHDCFDEPSGRLAYIKIYCELGVHIKVYPKNGDFIYQQRLNPNLNWNFELLKKELLGKVSIFYYRKGEFEQ